MLYAHKDNGIMLMFSWYNINHVYHLSLACAHYNICKLALMPCSSQLRTLGFPSFTFCGRRLDIFELSETQHKHMGWECPYTLLV